MGELALNLACGERIIEDDSSYSFINIDIRKLPRVHVICDVESLPFKAGVFDFILASDIIEHFPKARTQDIVDEWSRVIKKGGRMEIRTPNLGWIVNQYIEKKNTEHTSWLLYGGQDYEYNFHYVIFDSKWLSRICEKAGLSSMDYFEESSNFILTVWKE